MASLSVRRLDGEVIRRLKIQAQRDGLSVEETVRRILADAVIDVEPTGAMIRRIIGDDTIDLSAADHRRPVRPKFVIKPPLGAEPRPGSETPNVDTAA